MADGVRDACKGYPGKNDQHAIVLEVDDTVWSFDALRMGHKTTRRSYNTHKLWKQVLSINASTDRDQQSKCTNVGRSGFFAPYTACDVDAFIEFLCTTGSMSDTQDKHHRGMP